MLGKAKTMVGAIAAVCVLLTLWRPENAIFLVVLSAPPLLLGYHAWYKGNRSVETDSKLTALFFFGFSVAPLAILVVELILTLLFAVVCFYDQFDEWAEHIRSENFNKVVVHKTLGFYLFLALQAFAVAGMTEEAGKAFWARRKLETWGAETATPKTVLFAFWAVAAGFSTMESLLYVAFSSESLLERSISTLGRAVTAFPAHILFTSLSAINVIRRDFRQAPKRNWLRLLLPAVLLHGAYDYVLFMMGVVLTLSELWMLGLSSAFTLCFISVLFFKVRKELRALNLEVRIAAVFVLSRT